MTARAFVRVGLVAVSLGICAAGLVSCSGDGEGLTEAGDPITSSDQVAIIGPTKDNTLYEDATGSISNGAGEHFFVGRTGSGAIRRAVVAFDLARIPAGSRVTGATLTLHMSREPSTGGPEIIEIHRLLADWGEGASDAFANEGGGAAASPGDATWIHTFSDTLLWSSPGGDFSPTVSATQSVDAVGSYSWSGPALVADVQSWLDNPQGNFGWVLIGNESVAMTAKRFDTHENVETSFRPALSVQYATEP